MNDKLSRRERQATMFRLARFLVGGRAGRKLGSLARKPPPLPSVEPFSDTSTSGEPISVTISTATRWRELDQQHGCQRQHGNELFLRR